MFPMHYFYLNNSYFPLGYFPLVPSPPSPGGSGPLLEIGPGGTGNYREDGNPLDTSPSAH